MMRGRIVGLLLAVILAAGCGGNPYLEASLDPAELQGKPQSWFEENWGAPSGKASRLFGGEKWIYYRIAGGTTSPPFFNFAPNECKIELYFDKQEKLSSYDTPGC